jgi:hypothetical protein
MENFFRGKFHFFQEPILRPLHLQQQHVSGANPATAAFTTATLLWSQSYDF